MANKKTSFLGAPKNKQKPSFAVPPNMSLVKSRGDF
jgi:hypothetical protein